MFVTVNPFHHSLFLGLAGAYPNGPPSYNGAELVTAVKRFYGTGREVLLSRLGTIELLVLTCLDQLLFTLKI